MLHPIPAAWEITLSDSAFCEGAFELQEGALLLGASPDCDMVSSADGVAPRHAEFSVNDGALHVRILDGAPPLLLNSATVLDSAEVSCPASIQIGALSVLINRSVSTATPGRSGDSTLRIVHPAGHRLSQSADPGALDITGRIVYQLPDSETASLAHKVPGAPDFQNQKPSASFSEESTMAFSMESPDLEISDRVPVRIDYEVKGEIARGGMGKIYSAEDAELDRLVALKVSTAAERGRDSQFFREAKILAALAHPNIVPIHNLGVDAEGRPFYSMKLIQGRTLQWIIKQLAAGDLSIASVYTRERLLDVFRKVCDAVSFAHSKGYLHRDLKPENIMVGEFGEVLVMDWGLAKVIRRTPPEAGQAAVADAEPETLSYIEGTPQYMSPEQANGIYGGLDERSDIYSLGGVLYTILTHRPPVTGASVAEVIQKVRAGETTTMAIPRRREAGAAPLRIEQAVPEALRAVTLKALSRDKTTRYQSVATFAADVEAYQNGFATSAETAGVLRLFVLLVMRHRIASGFAAALLVAAAVFTLRLAASERSAQEAAANAAKQASIASANEQRAVESESRALEEKAAARTSAAKAQIALAEAAEQNMDASAMRRALLLVDGDHQDQAWRYLNRMSDSADWTSSFKNADYRRLVPVPEKSGVLLGLLRKGAIQTLDLTSGLEETVCLIQDAGAMAFAESLGLSSDAKTAAVSTLEKGEGGADPFTFQVHLVNLKDGTRRPLEATPLSSEFSEFHLGFSPDGKFLLVLFGKTSARKDQAIMFAVAGGAVLWSKSESWFDLYTFQETGKCRCFKASGQHADLDPRTGSEKEVADKPVRIQFKETGPISNPNSKGALFFFRGTIRSVDRKDGRILYENRLQTPQKSGTVLSYLDEGRLVASLSPVSESSAVLQIWDESGGQLLRSIPTAFHYHTRLFTHPRWQHVAVLDGPMAKVWSIRSVQEETLPMDDHISNGFAFFGPPGSLVIQKPRVGSPYVASILRLRENERRDTKLLEGIFNPVSFFSASRNGNILAFGVAPVGYAPASLRLFRNTDATPIEKFDEIPNPPFIQLEGLPWCFNLSEDGSVLWLGNGFHEASTGKRITPLDRSGLKQLDSAACWVGNENVVEIAVKELRDSGPSRTLVNWSIKDGKRTEEPAPDALAISPSPDGAHIAEAGSDMRVRIRDGATLKEEKTLRVHDAPVTGVAWHPTLPLLATASKDYTVRIWNLETESPVEEIGLFLGTPGKLYWSPDGKTLAVRTTNEMTKGRAGINLFTPKSCTPDGK
jgi:WD40 repeat protein/predicted Ser/Thr protein kinase